MARERLIAAIGEALLVEQPGGVVPGGIALEVALHAQRMGHIGVPISRIGQDRLADELLGLLGQMQLDVSHLQADPDLKTGQLIVRRLGATEQRRLDARAAFDNMQWDFDLDDIAQQADAAVLGILACRDGQSQSVIERFLNGCSGAVKVADLTDREPDGSFQRGTALAVLRFCDAAIVDDAALKTLEPGAGQERRDAIMALLREADLTMAVYAQPARPMELHSAQEHVTGAKSHAMETHYAAITAMLHGLLAGWSFADVLRCAERVMTYTAQQPLQQVPDDVLAAK